MQRNHLYRTLLILASIINYISAYLLILVWENYFLHYLTLILASLLLGIIVVDYEDGILYSIGPLIAGSIMALGLIVSPQAVHGAERLTIDSLILFYGSSLAKLLLVSIPLSLCIVLVGCSLAQYFR